jgi:hypothetical protein
MNTGQSLEGLEFIFDNEDMLNAHVESVGDDMNRGRKRKVDNAEESTVLPIQNGIFYI